MTDPTRIDLHGTITVRFSATPEALEDATKRFETLAEQARKEFPDSSSGLTRKDFRQVTP